MNANLERQLALLPDALAGHLAVTVPSLLLGAALAVPLGLVALRQPALRTFVLGVAGVVQTVPGLAFLALMVPLLAALGLPALGPLPVGLALTAYAVLPILRNTIVGIEGVDPAVVEAARALGMTPGQVRRHVELPLAAPVLLAGVRTAAVWVVGLGTLATPVGARSLGDFIFSGLQTRNSVAVLVGCLGAAGLALLFDGALAGMERAVRERRPRLALAVTGAVAVALGAAVWPSRPAGVTVVVGGKPFTEQYVLTRVIETRLAAAGLGVDRRDSLGSTVLLDALLSGEVDVAVDYSGTLWANYLKRTDSAPAEEVLSAVCAGLGGVRCLGAVGFENAYALAVRRTVAEGRRWTSIADLAPHAPSLKMGSDYEFLQRPEWAAVRGAYGLTFAAELTFDPTFLYEAVARGDADVVTAYTTDGRVAAFDLTLLDDPKGALPPYDAVILLSADCPAGVEKALAPLVGAIDVATMREANRRVDLGGETPEAAAAWLDAAVGR